MLSEDMRANSEALRAMGSETLLIGSVRHRVLDRIGGSRRIVWAAALAAAAVIVVMFGVVRSVSPERVPPPQVNYTAGKPKIELPAVEKPRFVARAPRRAPVQLAAKSEPLVVKMLTDDPDVVIYWLVNGENERKVGP
jgi:hypothetical protein